MSKIESDLKDITKSTKKLSAKREWIDIDGQRTWLRICPNCQTTVRHKNRSSWWVSRKKNSVCYSCKNSGENNPFFGKKHTDSHKEHMSFSQRELPNVYKSTKFGGVNQKTVKQCLGCENSFHTKLTSPKKYCTIECCNRSLSKRGLYSSFPERNFAAILLLRGEKFIHQYEIDGKFFDFYLVDRNILIEIDGIYWHNRDGVYDTPLHKKIAKNDQVKSEIAARHEITLIRIWENEINNVSKYLY